MSVSDLAEYRELASEPGSTSAWHFTPVDGLDGGAPEAFELMQFTVDGAPRPIRRAARAGSQTYTTTIGKSALAAGVPVKIAYTYRTLIRLRGSLFHLRLGQPTHGLTIEVDYGDSGIQEISVLDFMASSRKATVTRSPAELPERTITLNFDGWALPASGVAFVWALDDEAGPSGSKSVAASLK